MGKIFFLNKYLPWQLGKLKKINIILPMGIVFCDTANIWMANNQPYCDIEYMQINLSFFYKTSKIN